MLRLYKSTKLAKYKNLLESERKYKPYLLNESEERILDQKSLTSSRAFNRLFDETLNNIVFNLDSNGKVKKLSETQALSYFMIRIENRLNAKALTNGLNSEKDLLLLYSIKSLVIVK